MRKLKGMYKNEKTNRLYVLTLCLAFFSFSSIIEAQEEENLRYENYVYLDNIRTVQFHVDGNPLSIPMLPLDAGAQFELSFDDLDPDVKNYTYTFVHCDKNWNPSPLTDIEYADGFLDETLRDYEFSNKTLTEYTHYSLLFPNDDVIWSISGNYLLIVHEDEDEGKRVAITRRFMVVDYNTLVSIDLRQVTPSLVEKLKTHHEFDFVVNHEKTPIRNPQREITATVLQNHRWDNAITGVPPTYTRGNSIVFDYQNKVVFPASKEFRYFDMRSLRTLSLEINDILRFDDHYEVILDKDVKRGSLAYLYREDLNGNYLIDNFDDHSPELTGDYADVLFALSSPTEYYDADIFIVGAFNDWRLKDKMVYNNTINSYVAKISLKQGYHNYAYAFMPKGTSETNKSEINLSELEGDWYETKNEYTVLIYYHPIGSNYDQLVGSLTYITR
jgi:hypothetical protein